MKREMIGVVGGVIGIIGMILMTFWLANQGTPSGTKVEIPPALLPQFEQPAVAEVVPSKKAVWPEKARFAVVSHDGKVIAFMDKRDIVIAKGGNEKYRIKHIRMLNPELVISFDGRYLAAYCLWRHGIVVWDVEERCECDFVKFPEANSSFWFVENELVLVQNGKEVRRIAIVCKPVETRAVISDNGRVVAVRNDEKSWVLRDGKESSSFPSSSLYPFTINRDGSRLAARNAEKKEVVLLDLEGHVIKAVPGGILSSFEFSKNGEYLAVLQHYAYTIKILDMQGQVTELTSKTQHSDWPIYSFRWSNVEPTDSQPVITLDTGDHSSVQWKLIGNRWHQNAGNGWVFACLDQGFDFDEHGMLTKNAK